ncbi:MAG: hypothetical protein M1834_004697 [Cirrosporium novae-zelandiae]|nr:MAG: hypothetical protein M1834_004697 [Cirrosporium novae-zelandiae]
MALVDYSDSESSDIEDSKPVTTTTTSAQTAPKSSTSSDFKKVVSRSNPHKIQVSLPKITDENKPEETDGPPAKRARKGPGAFSGFNTLLPTPKRTAQAQSTSSGTLGTKRGLGVGVNLRTGAAPAFSRGTPESQGGLEQKEENADTQDPTISTPKPEPEVKLVGKTTIFKPLSVARSTNKKKKMISSLPTTQLASGTKEEPRHQDPKRKPKVSLFSLNPDEQSEDLRPSPSAQYQPMVYTNSHEPPDLDSTTSVTEPYPSDTQPTAASISSRPQTLDTIASDLNLSAAAKRQLFGRQRNSASSAINVINFNTDEEYKANEALRATGEQVQHNPVRAIAPGKHSLKQLVSAASTQREALEEQFASGRRNKKEAGSKYGW